MAKFLTITQKGYTFQVHDADKLVADETWTIERVAAFMSVHHVLNVMATKYAKGLTLRPAVAAIQYTLKCDEVTSADINKLNQYLVSKLIGIYQDPTQQNLLGRPLSAVLDEVTAIADHHVLHEQEPIEVLGRVITPPPFYSRPSKMEYDAIVEKEAAIEQAYWDKFNECLSNGTAQGHKILIREGSNVYTGIIVNVSPKCVYCDIKDEYGRLIQSGARFPRDSKRFVIESFK